MCRQVIEMAIKLLLVNRNDRTLQTEPILIKDKGSCTTASELYHVNVLVNEDRGL